MNRRVCCDLRGWKGIHLDASAHLDVSVAHASSMTVLDGVQQLGKVMSRRIVLEPARKRGEEPHGVVWGAGGGSGIGVKLIGPFASNQPAFTCGVVLMLLRTGARNLVTLIVQRGTSS